MMMKSKLIFAGSIIHKKTREYEIGKNLSDYLITFLGKLGNILVGFIMFNSSIFISHRTIFQFVMSGFYGALFFSLLKFQSSRNQFFGIIIILNLNNFTGRHLSII